MRAPRSMFLPLAAWDQPVARGRCKFLSLSKAESFGPYGPNSHRFRPSRRPQIPGKFLAACTAVAWFCTGGFAPVRIRPPSSLCPSVSSCPMVATRVMEHRSVGESQGFIRRRSQLCSVIIAARPQATVRILHLRGKKTRK